MNEFFKPWSRGIALLFFVLFYPPNVIKSRSPEIRKSADKIVILKAARSMTLENNGKPIKTYKIALGGQSIGPKQQQGDHKTPEGTYFVDGKNSQSQFHKALQLSYPSPADRLRAKKLGVSPGGDVEIHGLGKQYGWIGARHRLVDWTDGCIAVTNEEIEEVFAMVPTGTPVEIMP